MANGAASSLTDSPGSSASRITSARRVASDNAAKVRSSGAAENFTMWLSIGAGAGESSRATGIFLALDSACAQYGLGLARLSEHRADEPHAVVACPFGRARHRADFAAGRIDNHRGRHAESSARGFQVLKNVRTRVGVIGQMGDRDVFEKSERLLRVAGVDIYRDHFEIAPAKERLQGIERRHFAAARYTPGGPKVEEH